MKKPHTTSATTPSNTPTVLVEPIIPSASRQTGEIFPLAMPPALDRRGEDQTPAPIEIPALQALLPHLRALADGEAQWVQIAKTTPLPGRMLDGDFLHLVAVEQWLIGIGAKTDAPCIAYDNDKPGWIRVRPHLATASLPHPARLNLMSLRNEIFEPKPQWPDYPTPATVRDRDAQPVMNPAHKMLVDRARCWARAGYSEIEHLAITGHGDRHLRPGTYWIRPTILGLARAIHLTRRLGRVLPLLNV